MFASEKTLEQKLSARAASVCDSELHLSCSLLQSLSHKCLHLWHNYFQNQLRDVKQKIMTSGNEENGRNG